MNHISGGTVTATPPPVGSIERGLRLLGGFDLLRGTTRVVLPESGQRLVAYLAVVEHPATRERVAGSLWPDVRASRAMGNLRSALWRVRRADADLVETVGTQLRISTDVAVDVRRIAALARTAVHHPAAVGRGEVETLVDAADLLPEWDEDWLATERERIRQLRQLALERVCEAMTKQGRFAQAAEAGLAAVAADPFRESAQRALIAVLMAQGNGGEALRQFRRYEVTLARELGVRPTPAIEALVRTLRD